MPRMNRRRVSTCTMALLSSAARIELSSYPCRRGRDLAAQGARLSSLPPNCPGGRQPHFAGAKTDPGGEIASRMKPRKHASTARGRPLGVYLTGSTKSKIAIPVECAEAKGLLVSIFHRLQGGVDECKQNVLSRLLVPDGFDYRLWCVVAVHSARDRTMAG